MGTNPETELGTKLQTGLELADVDEDQGDALITDGDAHLQLVHNFNGTAVCHERETEVNAGSHSRS